MPFLQREPALNKIPRMLSRFSVVLLDMNGTFMFGGDRCSIPEEVKRAD